MERKVHSIDVLFEIIAPEVVAHFDCKRSRNTAQRSLGHLKDDLFIYLDLVKKPFIPKGYVA